MLEKLAASESSDLPEESTSRARYQRPRRSWGAGISIVRRSAVSGYAGAAAITTALAAMGGPGGMIGGIGVLILVGLVSRALTKWGLPKIAKPVIRGLIATGSTPADIHIKVSSYPKWVISGEIRAKIYETLASFRISYAILPQFYEFGKGLMRLPFAVSVFAATAQSWRDGWSIS